MGLTHCPLCVGLAVLCAMRYSVLAVLVWRMLPDSAAKSGLDPFRTSLSTGL
jgi:hypothetical protein